MDNFIDDIPEARRETSEANIVAVAPRGSLVPWLGGAAVLVLGAGAGLLWWQRPQAAQEPAVADVVNVGESSQIAEAAAAAVAATLSEDSSADPSLLGHRPYEVISEQELTHLGPIRLKPEAARAVETMLADAKAAGVSLGVISGFRSLEDQEYLFFDIKAERGESPQVRAEVSAPPGYSEHHTGYAVDFIDRSQPATDLEESFEGTAAFAWLQEHAAFYGFEMSFPKQNQQNVAYEPWHWRYVGNQESLELFYRN